MNSHLLIRERELNAPKINKLKFNPDPFEDVKTTINHIGRLNNIQPVYKMNEQTEYKKAPIKNILYELPKQNIKPLMKTQEFNNKISSINKPDNINKFYSSKKF
jgi:hypothetical protein